MTPDDTLLQIWLVLVLKWSILWAKGGGMFVTVGHRGHPPTPHPSSQSTIQTWLNAKKRKDNGIFKQTLRFN